jgi:translation initiation factor IF-2
VHSAPDEWEDMTDNSEQETKRPLSLGARPGGRLELKKPIDSGSGQVRQTFTHGRSKTVQVEVVKRRVVEPVAPSRPAPGPTVAAAAPAPAHIPVVRPASPTPHAPVVRSASPAPHVVQAREPEPVVQPLAEPIASPPAEIAPDLEVEAAEAVTPAAPVEESAPEAVEAAPESAESPVPAERRPVQTARPEPTRVAPPRPGQKGAPSAPGTLRRGAQAPRTLTEEERASRVEALKNMMRADEQAKRQAEQDAQRRVREELDRQRQEDEARRRADAEARQRTLEEQRRKAEEEEKRKVEDAARKAQKTEEDSRREVAVRAGKNAAAKVEALTSAGKLKPAV